MQAGSINVARVESRLLVQTCPEPNKADLKSSLACRTAVAEDQSQRAVAARGSQNIMTASKNLLPLPPLAAILAASSS